MKLWGALFGMILLTHSAAAADLTGATIDCRFSEHFAGEISNGGFAPVRGASKDFVITFSGFGANGTAQMIGNVGAAPVFYDVREGVLVLAQLFGSPIRTITSMPLPRRDGAVQAAHSRHVWYPGTSAATISQWGGPCRLR